VRSRARSWQGFGLDRQNRCGLVEEAERPRRNTVVRQDAKSVKRQHKAETANMAKQLVRVNVPSYRPIDSQGFASAIKGGLQ
jgi:hypothetical protein